MIAQESRDEWVVQQLGPMHADAAARTLAEAFWNDPVYLHVLPKLHQRRRVMFGLQKLMVDYCMTAGLVHGTPECTGIACWFPPAGHEPTSRHRRKVIGMFVRAFVLLPLGCLARSLRLFVWFDRLRNATISDPHVYLWTLGVEPGTQGKGIGRAVIQPVLECADRMGLPCYLETANGRNRSFYRPLGFEVTGEYRGRVPGMTIWTMVRPARCRA